MYPFKKTTFNLSVLWYLIIALSIISSIPSDALSMFIPSSISQKEMGNESERAGDLAKIQNIIEGKLVSQRLSDLGLTKDEISSRLNMLSDKQIHQVALNLDSLHPGGDSGLGIIISLLIVAILVVILLQITGHKLIIVK